MHGIIATRFTGPWEIAHAEKFKPEGFEYEYTFMPVPDGHKGPVYTYGDPKNIVIFKTCKDPLSAWNFIKTMIASSGDLRLLKITNQLPRRRNLKFRSFFSGIFRQQSKNEDLC